MPLKQIAPPNRPLFQCPTCGFVNSRGELCLQCTRSGCARMTDQNGSVKRRRVSAPQPLNDAQKEQLRKIQQRLTSTLYKPTQEQASRSVDAFALYRPETTTLRKKRRRDAAVLSIGDVAAAAHLVRKALAMEPTNTYHHIIQSPEANFYVRSIIVTRTEHVEASSPSSLVKPDPTDPNTPELEQQKTESPSICTPTHSPQRTLRRKQRFSLSRQRSMGASLRSRTGFRLTNFAPNEATNIPPTPLNSPAVIAQGDSTAATTNPLPSLDRVFGAVPLGSPSRPFYTAIRKSSPYTIPSTNPHALSRVGTSNSEYTSLGHPRARSLDLQPSFDFGEGDNPLSSYFCRPYAVDISSGAATGCSVSGEIELRMALARRNTIGGSAEHPEYRFEYTQAAITSGGKRGSGVKLRVKKIGQGLRNLVFLRRPSSPILA